MTIIYFLLAFLQRLKDIYNIEKCGKMIKPINCTVKTISNKMQKSKALKVCFLSLTLSAPSVDENLKTKLEMETLHVNIILICFSHQ